MNTSTDAAPLKRVVGVGSLGLNIVNLTIASGIFALPAGMALRLGSAAPLAYLVCALLFGLVGLCFAEAGSRVGSAGGLYAYARVPFGPVVGGVAGTLLWVASGASADAAIVNLLTDTLAKVIPALAAPWVRVAIILGLFAVVTVINIRGARNGVRLSVLMTIIKIAPLVLLAVVGLFVIDWSRLIWTTMPSLGSLGGASVSLFFAFIGVEAALSMSGEVVRPARTVPRAILLGLLMIGSLYVGLQLVAQGALGNALATSQTPLVDSANLVLGSWGGAFLAATLALSASGCIAGDLLSTPRVLFAFAQQGQLPRQVASVHSRFGTPWIAIIVYAVVCAGLALSGTFTQLAVISTSGTLILYLICCLGVLRLRARKVAMEGEPFVAPGGPVVPILAVGVILWMLGSLTRPEQWSALVFVVVVTIIFAVHTRMQRASTRS
jgi:APA family basic amino acid/polyamine antiporter